MSKLKKTALVSLSIFAITCLIAVIAVPFALKSSIAKYNQLVGEDISLYDTITIDKNIENLNLEFQSYSDCKVLPSPDNNIYIKSYDYGFYKAALSHTINDNTANVVITNKSTRMINEDTFKKALLSSMNNHYDLEVLIPQNITVSTNKPYFLSFFTYDFANGEEFENNAYNNKEQNIDLMSQYYDNYNSQLLSLESIKSDSGLNSSNGETFFSRTEYIYDNIMTARTDLAKLASKNYDTDETLNTALKNIQTLTLLEQKRDLEEMKAMRYYYDLSQGSINTITYNSLTEESTNKVKEYNLQIEELNQKFENYISNNTPKSSIDISADNDDLEVLSPSDSSSEPKVSDSTKSEVD